MLYYIHQNVSALNTSNEWYFYFKFVVQTTNDFTYIKLI